MRNGSVEYLRFVGALGIVWFHMGLVGASTALAALPMFIMLLVYFGVDRALAPQIRRLMVPWVFWSLVFLAAKAAQSALVEKVAPWSDWHLWMVFTGGALHLWFLPFSLGFVIFAKAMSRFITRPWVWLGLAGSLGLISIWLANHVELPIPLAQWATVIAPAFLGVLMVKWGKPVLVLGLGIGFFVGTYALGWEVSTWPSLVAAGVLLLAFLVPLPSTRVSRWLSDVSFGIYLCHPLVIAGLAMVWPGMTVSLFAAGVAGSVVVTVVLMNVPRLFAHKPTLAEYLRTV